MHITHVLTGQLVLTGCPGRYQYNIAFPCGRARSYRVSSSNKSNSPENGLHYVMIPWQESCRIVALSESRRTCSTVSTQFGTQFDMDVSSRRPGTILRRRDRRAQRWRKTPSRGKGVAAGRRKCRRRRWDARRHCCPRMQEGRTRCVTWLCIPPDSQLLHRDYCGNHDSFTLEESKRYRETAPTAGVGLWTMVQDYCCGDAVA
jgi:hypothetical protein